MKTPRERAIERACVKHARELCIGSRKLQPPPAGWPDRVFILPGGVSWWVEFKRPGSGRLSPLQAAILAGLGNLGHAWNVIDSVEVFKRRLRIRLTGSLRVRKRQTPNRRKTPNEVEPPPLPTRSREARAR